MNHEIATTAMAMMTSQGITPKSDSLPMNANDSCGLKIVVSCPISRAMPRTAVSEPSVTMNGGSLRREISAPLISPKPARPQRDRHGEAAEARNVDASKAATAGRRQHGAHRQVDTAGQDDEGHARSQHDVDRRLLRDDRQVLQAEEMSVR